MRDLRTLLHQSTCGSKIALCAGRFQVRLKDKSDYFIEVCPEIFFVSTTFLLSLFNGRHKLMNLENTLALLNKNV